MNDDAKDFRDYLESTGCEQALCDILVAIDAMKIKPEDPIEYMRQNIDPKLTEEFENLKNQINEANEQLNQLSEAHPTVYEKFNKLKRKMDSKKIKTKSMQSEERKSPEIKTNQNKLGSKKFSTFLIDESATMTPSEAVSAEQMLVREKTTEDVLRESSQPVCIEVSIQNDGRHSEERRQTQISIEFERQSIQHDPINKMSENMVEKESTSMHEVTEGEYESTKEVSLRAEEANLSDTLHVKEEENDQKEDSLKTYSIDSDENEANSMSFVSIDSDSEKPKRKFLCC